MWAAGSVCFFAAWGRSGVDGESMNSVGAAFSFNLIAGLIAVMVLGDIIIVNPVIRLAGGGRAFNYEEKKPFMFLLGGLFHAVKVTALILLIVQTYYFINVFCINIFKMDENSVPVPLEPFLFGILYGLYYLLFDIIQNLFTGRKHEKSVYQQHYFADERGAKDRGAPDSGLYRNDDPAPHS
jgi:hypothetical protein